MIPSLIVLAVGHQIYGADQISIGIVLNEVMEYLGTPLALGGLLATLFGVGQIVGSNPAGWILERRGPKFTFSLAMGIFSLFTFLTGFVVSYWDAAIYRVCFGIGQGVWNVTYYSTIGKMFAKRRGLAAGVLGVMPSIGMLWGAPATALMFVSSGNWRLPFFLLGILGFLILFLIILTAGSIPSKEQSPSLVQRERAESHTSVLKNRNVFLGSIIGVFFALSFSSIAALYPTYLRTALHFDPIAAGIIVSVQTWAIIAVAPIFLILSDRYGRRRFLCYYGLSQAAAAYLMFHVPVGNFPLAVAANFIYGVAGAGTFPMVMIFMQDSVPYAKIGASTGFANLFLYVGVTAAGPITGYVASLLGWSFAAYWLVACGIVFFAAAFFIKEMRVRKPQ